MTIRALSGTTSPRREMTVIEDSATHVVELVEPVAVNLRTLGVGLASSTNGWGVLSALELVGGIWAVTVASPWGVTADGRAYYDPEGVIPSDAAVASLDPNGALILTRPEVEPVAVNPRALGVGLASSTNGWGVLSALELVGGIWAVTVASPWGVTADGQVYYDLDGAVPSDAAVASLDPSGALVLTRPRG